MLALGAQNETELIAALEAAVMAVITPPVAATRDANEPVAGSMDAEDTKPEVVPACTPGSSLDVFLDAIVDGIDIQR